MVLLLSTDSKNEKGWVLALVSLKAGVIQALEH